MELSIILPYYNHANKLYRLLRTLPIDKKEVEVIVVNDHSNLNNEIYEKIKKKYEANNVIFMDNDINKKGAGSAVNKALKHAKGKWITLVGADDYFLKNNWTVLSKYFDCDVDTIFFTPISVEEYTTKLSDRHSSYKKIIYNYKDEQNRINELYLRYGFHSACSRLIKRKFIEKYNLRFAETHVANDVKFSIRLGHYMKNFIVTKEVFYCITKDKGSLTTTVTDENFITRLKINLQKYKFLRKYLSEKELELFEPNGIPILVTAIQTKMKLNTIQTIFALFKKNKINIFKIKRNYINIRKMIDYVNRLKQIKKFRD
ncbi:hypothetical protein AN639_02275 [Candidatus Epulonipiscium fishelsonii]|uniref:Uncharacterized protein n=1 Tax=Candidatus Epulonipiscium fishelsonii TaxID=77094 RepID=A0ACC8XH30_9FIRM|nr:hypothetical protein AN639_02275 [Epulopiscium sp. SCG-B05WGA-EpuloA1]ONI42999.1 hypothetical protein AN396_00110 [Epulopiscium sp. SCG-B11WGA-EpuloA1]